MKKAKIALIMLTLNEEPRIEEALRQFRAHVDFILVVDGGSTDKTVQLAEKIADKVIYDADKDFSAIKNRARLQVPKNCNWLLWADADEKWPPSLVENLKVHIGELAVPTAFRIPRCNEGGRDWPDYQVRIFPNSRDIEWRGLTHETPYFIPENTPLDQMDSQKKLKHGKPILPVLEVLEPIVHLPRRTDIHRPWW